MSDILSIFSKRNKKKNLHKTISSSNKKKNILINDKSRRKAFNLINTNKSNKYNNNNNNIKHNFKYSTLDNSTFDITDINSSEYNKVLVDFPKIPIKDIESCEDVYNIFYMRDQYLMGNKNIDIDKNDTFITLETVLDKLDSAISEVNIEDNYPSKKVLSSVYEKILNLYKSFKAMREVQPRLSTAYDGFESNILFIKAKTYKKNYVYDNIINIYTHLENSTLEQNNIETLNQMLSINDTNISNASFVNKKNVVTTNEHIEYLPIKFNPHFIELNQMSIYYLYEESINHIIWQKALDELIVVKALADIPYFDLTQIEGFDFNNMKSGQRQWYPLYIAKELSEEGLATVEFPFWFYIDNLNNIYKKEFEDTHELTDLPSPYFFEISSMFLENNAFKNSTPIETIGHRTPYKYILKVADIHMGIHIDIHMGIHMGIHIDIHMDIHMGIHIDIHMDIHMGLIQDIRQKRIHKIMKKLKSYDVFSEILIINNIQIYETYCVNYLASAFFQKEIPEEITDESLDVKNYLFAPFVFSSYNS
ncbi:conserved protein, unknown function [Hepatocystis sp. ex Piliocolobus tephrosceles]|nr:conserved protein, unknown function [Hepatocystis sp. ex Piliocolobus tephrosceles]